MTDGTKEKIMAAALETLRDEGIARTSARAIARHGDFNQALIFYHFGSVSQLLIEAANASSRAQVGSFQEQADEVGTLGDLVEIARGLHEQSSQAGSVAVVVQMMAGAVDDAEMGKAVLRNFEGWIDLVAGGLEGALGGNAIGQMIPYRDAAYAISAMFLGMELMARLDPERRDTDRVFDLMQFVAGLMEGLLAIPEIAGEVGEGS